MAYWRPSVCELRVFLQEKGEPEAEPGAFDETMQLDVRHAGIFHLALELIKKMNVRVAVLVREKQPLAQCQQFRQESVAHWDAARACRGLGLPDVPATDALFAVEARLLPNEDFLRAGTDVGVVQVRDLHVPASR